ncbi:MAG: ABC transporter ATP-binding protein [Bacillota bacterium]|jgi:ATP-binding cassette subfamily B protein|nr:ABC transporter ATP-binding protein [Candidatus Fermentithermobacillaceae bacterium]
MSEYDLDELIEEAEERPFNMEYFLRILGYTRPYRKTAVKASILTLAGIIIGLLEPLLFKRAIDEGVMPGNTTALIVTLAVLLALRLVQWAASRVQIRTINVLGQQVLYDLRQGLFTHIESLPFAFFDHRPVGKIVSRITNDVNHIGNLAASGIVNLISQLLSLIGIVEIMLYLNWKMALLSFVTIPLLGFVLTKVRWALEDAWGDTRKAVASINAHLNETIQGLSVIQAYGYEKHNSVKFSGFNKKYFDAYMRAIRLDQAFWPLTDIVGAIGTAIVIWYGTSSVVRGTMTIGLVVAFVNYLGKFWAPISTFSRVWSQILSAMASAERVFTILDLRPETGSVAQEGLIEVPRLEGEVVFEDVCFAYKPGEPVLTDVCFRVSAGETIALVGPTGAGKTTIINLLARFYQPSSGKVTVDGYDLAQVSLPSYRSQLGIVLQDTLIFSGTIKDNLLFGKPDATMEEVVRAAKAACIHDFIESMPKGYDSEVTERGTNLSAGQRQLLAFARAILADPRILILDEATSSVDPETEQLIQQALKTLLRGRTSFIIAHRLSTVRSADRIMVIEGGQITESGTHDELVALGGRYANLYQAQFRRA